MAALGSVGSALILVSLKVFLAVATGSLGILSEALHSGLDLVAAILTWFSVRVSDRPADSGHTYGHGKIESFSAFVETGLLLATSVYIIVEAFVRLLYKQVHLEPSALAILILGLAMGIDLIRSRALARVARQYPSEALEADALHFSTDVWSTFVVILGMMAVWAGQYWSIAWLQDADPIAALVVAAIVIWIGSRLGKRTMDALLDVAPAGLQKRVTEAVEGLEGVLSIERVRVRRAGNQHFVDVTISVPRSASFEQVHAISDAVEQRVGQIVPADVMVHMEPRAVAGEHLFDAIRAIAARRGLAIHEISADQLDGRLFIELHLEVPEQLSLRDAHYRATGLEEEIRTLSSMAASSNRTEPTVNIHIEPLGTHIASVDGQRGEMTGLARAIGDYINTLPREYHELVDCHDVHVRQVEHKILASCHCAMDGSLPITQIHDVTAALEDRVKEHFSQVARVTIHPEPVEDR
ncbi:MAG TPA: cation diffusion facilitator family transporter [Candidatus Dormibacteraeota bacterium]|nr:cation diffusion facilitator family transporter [Candidatus Dormibacteraeota bacterium]